MLYWALVEQARHEHMPDKYKNRYIIIVLLKPPSWIYQTNRSPPQLVPSELIKGAQVKSVSTMIAPPKTVEGMNQKINNIYHYRRPNRNKST